MTGRERRCAHCWKPLRVTARSDARFCSAACKAAERRWRQHLLEAVAIGLWYTQGIETEHVTRCPACGRRFAHGHGHRRDTVYLYSTVEKLVTLTERLPRPCSRRPAPSSTWRRSRRSVWLTAATWASRCPGRSVGSWMLSGP
ncbi:hypothetical protein [Streptomyces sp. NPDC052097]|uniref:hypothetical protein n=1 Tax=Streptomyces sp. NPDC052097 TaxID=3154948 RepID=UPI003450AC54